MISATSWGLVRVLVVTTVPIFASILRVPFAAVAPMIVVYCAIGAYAIQNAIFDIWLMLGFGVVGYVFKKTGIPLAPFTLALVRGNRAEDAFRLSMIGSGGDMKVFLVERSGRLDHDAGDRAAVLDRSSTQASVGGCFDRLRSQPRSNNLANMRSLMATLKKARRD